MRPILYDENNITYGVVPSNNGLGVLSDALSCNVIEERNGSYELEMSYPASGIHAKDFALRHLIKAKPNFTDDHQLFRIYKIGKVINSSFKVYARHISYDLSGVSIESGSASSCISACALLSTNEFTIDTDKTVTANFSITEPSSRRSWLGGKSGSLLDVFGTGEYKYDNFNIHFLLHRGTNRGVEVRYGKNLLSLSQENDSSNLTTHIILFWKSFEDGSVVYSSKVSTGVNLDCEQTQCIDVSDAYETAPTVQELNDKALTYIASHNYSVAKNNIKLNFLQIKSLKDRVDLCDEVSIIYEDFGINATAKCIKTTWNVLKEQYESIELGDARPNFASTFISTGKETLHIINTQASMLAQAINNATELITGNSGGYVVIHDSNGDGEPDEILIMDTNDISTATKVWRWNSSGLGYSNTGYSGNYGLAMTMDGAIVANYITSGFMSANRIRAGRLEDVSGNNYFDLDSGQASFENLNIEIQGQMVDAGTVISQKPNSSQIRTAFAADSTSITISSGTITFNADSFLVNATNLEIAADGSIKSKSFKSNSSIDFYTPNWQTQLMTIGYYAGLGAHLVMNNNQTGDDYRRLEINPMFYRAYCSSGGNDLAVQLGAAQDVIIDQGGLSYQNYGQLTLADHTYNNTIELHGNYGRITCVSLVQTSTRKAKENINNMSEVEANKILEINPVIFDFKDKTKGLRKAGFIAEDVQEVLPKIIAYNKDGEAVGINYIELIPYLTKMIQLQQLEINKLKELSK